jgi:hypothetical protein
VEFDPIFVLAGVIVAALLIANLLGFRQAFFYEGVEKRAAEKEAKLAAARAARAAQGLPELPAHARAFGWKALSPFVFAVAVLFSIAIGGPIGFLLFGLATANLIFGLTGWDHYVPGRS